MKYVVVGAGFFGAVLAERVASVLNRKVLLVDRRSHTGGNSHSEFDPETGIECHKYGSHIFHTSRERVWKFLRSFTEFTDYRHKVFATCSSRVYQMPINLKTINDFYGLNLSPREVPAFLENECGREKYEAPRNLEEKAISLIGRPLYEALIRGYTLKQWNADPKILPAEIITRLPVRSNYNADYFSDSYQGVPVEGYGRIFDRMLDHPNISLRLNTAFSEIAHGLSSDDCVVYTGMLDELFDYSLGVLGWRSLRFEWEQLGVQDYQGTTVMNYCDTDIPYTRIHEFKHYHPERRQVFESQNTVICREFSADYRMGDDAYYPVNTSRNAELYARYKCLFWERFPGWFVGGRLGSYQYWDMDRTIDEALELFEKIKEKSI